MVKPMKDEQKNNIIMIANSLEKDIWKIAREIGHHPEQGYQEFHASQLLSDYLKQQGFTVEKPLAGIETAFRAHFSGSSPGRTLAFLAEYDALPDIGHGCGHNLIGAASVGAAVVLSRISDLPGDLIVVGSPAEETSGAKVPLTEAGIFKDVDAALMFHPGSGNVPHIASLALDAIEVSFYGRGAHMAASEGIGINALDAILGLFQKVNKLKKRLARDERIDGIITQGGKAPNIVPDKAVARFYLRAGKKENLNRIREIFLASAEKSAREVGAKMSWRYDEHSYHEMRTNSPLAETFRDNLLALGVKDIEPPQMMLGSVDMGNVSHVVPAIHAYLRMGKGLEVPHTTEFAEAATSEKGEEVLALAVKVLALTGRDVLTNKKLQERMHKDWMKGNNA